MFYWKKLLSKRQMICTRLQGLSMGRLRGWEILTHLLFVFHRSQMKLTLKWGEHLTLTLWSPLNLGFPVGSVVKNLLADAGDVGLITGLERSPGGGNGKPLQYSCLENPMNRGAWWATVHRGAKSQIWPSIHTLSLISHNQSLRQHLIIFAILYYLKASHQTSPSSKAGDYT